MRRSPDHARTLLDRARGDALVLKLGLSDSALPGWIVGFHAQQAVEKAIKAVLTVRSVAYPPTHDLEHLLELCETFGIAPPPYRDRLLRLTPFGAALRYEDDAVGGMALDRPSAHATVREVLAWAEALVA